MEKNPPTLVTPTLEAGLALADTLAGKLQTQLTQAASQTERPGGMNYLQPAPVPKEVIAAIYFQAIAMVNRGWEKPKPV